MPVIDPAARALLGELDRFLQWDLVTVSPWGAPAISPVGARLIPEEATVWTSTTVGYAAKVRNIKANPKVALLRSAPGQGSYLVRGEARVVAGDGTLNLAQLFRLMGGSGGARRFFATSVRDPFWSRLYRSYWHRFLIAVRIVDISTLGPAGWEVHRVARWSGRPRAGTPAAPARRRRGRGLLDSRGRDMLESGTPVALATVSRPGACPMVWPVSAVPAPGGAIEVSAGHPLPSEQLPRSSLAVRVIDDSFEVAQMVGWIGTLESGQGPRRLLPRATYGFIKPPGVVGDLAAGMAALVRGGSLAHPSQVTPPNLERAIELGGGEEGSQLSLRESGWVLLEQIFARRNAAAPWYAGMAALVSDPGQRHSLRLLAERARLERDWAHGLLARGSRRVGARRLAAGALALHPNPAAPEATALREEERVGRLLSRLRSQLPHEVAGPPVRVVAGPPGALGTPAERIRDRGLPEATLAAATAVAAALDRWKERSRG